MLGPAAKDIWAGTFHSICVRILRQNIHHIGYDNAFTIYDTDDAKRLVTQIMKESNIDADTLPVKASSPPSPAQRKIISCPRAIWLSWARTTCGKSTSARFTTRIRKSSKSSPRWTSTT